MNKHNRRSGFSPCLPACLPTGVVIDRKVIKNLGASLGSVLSTGLLYLFEVADRQQAAAQAALEAEAALNATATASTCDLSSADVEMLQGVLRGMSQHTGDQHCLYNISLDAILAM